MREWSRKGTRTPKKSLGQHFLRCRWVIDTLLKAAELERNDTVLEVGPGTGVLTRRIAPLVRRLIAVEKDERIAEELSDALRREGIGNVTLIPGDILEVLQEGGIANTLGGTRARYKALGNIPYYLTSRLLRLLLEEEPRPERIIFTIQKEVAARITARPPHMNLLALSVQAFGQARVVEKVPRRCFSPVPRVDSAIIKIAGISDQFFRTARLDERAFFALIRLAFSKKRKLLAHTLVERIGRKRVTQSLADSGIRPNARAQELSLDEWAKLCRIVSVMGE